MSEMIGVGALGSRTARRKTPLTISVGIEGTFEPFSRRDTLEVSRHFQPKRWTKDFGLVRKLGLGEFRYPVPWHRVERSEGQFDWRELDRVLSSAFEDQDLEIIADTLHHTSYPVWIRDGFFNDRFVERYVAFIRAFAERYPRVRFFTPFNEPTCTLDFCGYRGFWHPYARGDQAYVAMLRNTARASAEAIHMFRQI